MKCVKCDFDADYKEFRYLYNARIDAPISIRQCPKCGAWNSVDEMTGEAGVEVVAGGAPWGKSAGVEGVAEEVKTDETG